MVNSNKEVKCTTTYNTLLMPSVGPKDCLTCNIPAKIDLL